MKKNPHRYCLRILLPSVLIIGIIGLVNCCFVNNELKRSLDTIEQSQPYAANSIVEGDLLITNSSDLHEIFLKLGELRHKIFDDNTITFLITLIITLLAGTFIILQDKLRKDHDEFKDSFEGAIKVNETIDKDRFFISNLQSLFLMSIEIEAELEESKYAITDSIIRRLYYLNRKADWVIANIPENVQQNKFKIQLIEIISDSIRSLQLETITKSYKEDALDLILLKPLQTIHDKLRKIESKIKSLKVIDTNGGKE
jgi:hypothetical protein